MLSYGRLHDWAAYQYLVNDAIIHDLPGIIAFGWLKFILKNSRGMIKFMLIFSVVFNIMCAVAAFAAGLVSVLLVVASVFPPPFQRLTYLLMPRLQWFVAAMSLLWAAIGVCYWKCVQNRIPFASTNLAVASTALRHYWGSIMVACLMTGIQLVWQFVWTLALLGATLPKGGYSIKQGGEVYSIDECRDMKSTTGSLYCVCSHDGVQKTQAAGQCIQTTVNGFYIFLLLISFFWGSFILSNIVHCTTAVGNP